MTLKTIRPRGRGHHDVREMQVRRERGGLTVWMHTDLGFVLVRDRYMLDELAESLRRGGYGAKQLTTEGGG